MATTTKTTEQTAAARSRRVIDILRAEGVTVETFFSEAIGRWVTIPDSLTPEQENLIYHFSRHYSITKKMAENALVNGGWNWTRALADVTATMKAGHAN